MEAEVIRAINQLAKTVRVIAYDNGEYREIVGYEISKHFGYDENGNLSYIEIVVLSGGEEVRVRRTLAYDSDGNIVEIGRWEVV